MRYRKAAISLAFLVAVVFSGSFLLSYKLSPRGFFDFGEYIKDLKKAGQSIGAVFSTDEDAQGADQESEDQKDEDNVKSEKKEQTGSEGAGSKETIVYPNLKGYLGKNPYSTILGDRDIVRNMRYLLGAEGYSYFLKSIPDAKKVELDSNNSLYSIEGSISSLKGEFAGLMQIDENGDMYIAYLYEDKLLYYTSDRDYSTKVMKNSRLESWIDSNIAGRELVYMNK